MKNLTILLLSVFGMLLSINMYAQTPKVVVVGLNHTNPDGLSFVVTDALAANEVIYFTENEYNSGGDNFNTGEAVVQYTASASGLAVGQVVHLSETGTSTNAFNITCTQGSNCGTATSVATPFSIATGGEHMYAYSDTDSDPTNGITQVHSLLYTFNTAIPALENPLGNHPTAVIVAGFTNAAPDRTEYQFSPATLRDGVSQANLENPANYLNGSANAPLSLVEFTNLNLAGANPVLTVTSAPAGVLENSGSSITYTFTLDSNAASNITVNFNVGGTATFTTDYTQSGAATFNATSGTVQISSGSSSAAVTITPVGDSMLEPNETVILTATAGTGYDVGAPGAATSSINNDDSMTTTPLTAVVGLNEGASNEAFSFVALDDIPASTTIYFTENEWQNNLLAFNSGEAVIQWTSPASVVGRGEVIVATETAANTFTTSCNSGTCGTVTIVSGNFALAATGEGFYSYTDTDNDPTNGVTQVDSVLYTGPGGGNIPSNENPAAVYTGSVVVDGFPAVNPQLTEYDPSLRGVTVDQANFQNTTDWLHMQPSGALSTVPFADIIIATGPTLPQAVVSVAPGSVVEDSGSSLVYTFTLSAAQASDVTINFSVSGTATFTTDYTVTGAATFNASSGSVVISAGSTTAFVTATPVVDAVVEPTETINLMISSGTGYNAGTPNDAVGNITNDDTSSSDPLVAVMGMSHAGPDGFSFVAAQNIPAGTVVYFTEDEFDNSTLLFSAGESVLQWTSPAGQIDQGDVITVTENATADTFTIACSDTSGNGCGTIAVIQGGFALATNGETLYAYEDSDTDPTNGVDDIYSVMYTGNATTPGGNLPPIEDPSGIYTMALVVDGFPATSPDKTEYTPGSRGIPVTAADFENPANYDHAFAFGTGLDTTPFAALTIVVNFTAPADLCVDAGVQAGLGGGSPAGGVYSGPGVTDDGNGMTYSFDPAAAGVGIHTITYTVSGSSASDDIEVFALPTVTFTAPADLCIDAGVQAGLGGGTPTGGVYSGPGVTDDGNGMTYSFDPAAAGVGTHTITYTFTDTNACTNSASDDVEVFALPTVTFTAPADLCIDAGVQAGLGGGSPTGGVYSGPGVTDDGNGMTYSFDPAAAGVGTHTITYTFTDTNACTNSASDDVEVYALPTVTFTAPASPVCPNTVLTGQGGGTPTGGVYSGPGVTDDGNGMTYTFDSGAAGTGTHTLTYTFTDANGCTNSASDNVTVEDTTPPTLTCPANITVSNDSGMCSAVVNFNPTASDNCGTVTVVSSPASGSTFPVGTTTVNVTATDGSGNTATCSFTVTVNDTENPTISCPADITVSNDPGLCEAVVNYATPVGSDNCPGSTTMQTAGLPSGSSFPVGTTTNTFMVTDASGNTAMCSFDVIVNDDEAPVITCPVDITLECGTGGGSGMDTAAYTGGTQSWTTAQTGLVATLTADLTGIPATATIDDVNVSFDIDHSWVGDLEITLISPDGTNVLVLADPTCGGSGNSDNVTATLDDESGVGSVSANCTGGVSTGGASDACDADYATNAAIDGTFDPDNPLSALDGGTAAGTWTLEVVDDASGDAGCIFNFSVDVTWSDGSGGTDTSPAVTGTATATDNCDPNPVITFSDTSVPGCGNTETITRVWTATDADGNSSSCTQIITVVDTTPPTVSCPSNISVNNDPGVCGAVVNYTIPAMDSCGMVTITQTAGLASGSTFPVGTTTNTFDVSDECGNTVVCSFDVTVTDNEPPVAVCMDITVQLDANGMASITPSDIDGGSTDNCGIASLSVSPSTFDCSDVGNNTATMTVTDVNGNSSTCTAVVTVEDNVPPVAVCMDITIALDENGMASITPADVDGGSSDACGIADLSIDVMDFTCGDVGPNNVTLTVTDNNGNTSTCIAVVTVVDDMPPAISCPADVVTGVNTGECGAIVTFADAIAFDICGIASVTQTDGLPSGSFFPVGVSTIEFTAEDVNGNTSVCSFTITVEDDEAPMAICQNITVELDANGNASITPADVDGGSTDNCGVITDISIDIDTFDCSNLGDNPVVLSVTDDNGNTGSCTAIVTVIDVTAPEAICMDITVALDASGNATIVATDVDGGSTDACGVTSYSIDVDTFDCSHVGDNPVVLTVTDASGNSSSCTAIVTVEDTTNPVVECMDIIVGLDQNGQASITATDLVASATDACGIDSISADITEFDCDDLAAPVAVNVFVTDINGNLSTCTALVTVKDGLDPVISCPADQTIEITDGSQYEVPDYFATGEITAVDNCTDPVVITTQDPAPGTLLDEGTYTITVTAEDDSGNIGTCDFEITIVGVLGNNDRLDITSIGMYPNPASEVVMISNPQHIELEQAMIFDLTGRLIQTFDLRAMSDSISLDISMLSTATYTVVIQAAEGQISKRLIKE